MDNRLDFLQGDFSSLPLQPVHHAGENLARLLKQLIEQGGSDLHLKSGAMPRVRVNGNIADLSREPLSPQAINEIAYEMMTQFERERFEREKEVDFIYESQGLGRFRVNAYQQMKGLALAIRHITTNIPTLEDLNLPPVLLTLISRPRGLLLVTGATGSGKSTTLAALIETLNNTVPLNIITIEDPIEFAFKEKKCSIQQREIGRDTPSWTEALKRIMRQDPDVIVLGELRDSETMMTALSAANTGHLVLATLHTMDATQTINRVLSYAPTELQGEVRYVLASTLVGVISLRLLRRTDGKGRIPAVEVLVTTETIRKLIEDPKLTANIRGAIAEGFGQYGMQTFDQALMQLHKDGRISLAEALKHATSSTDFKIKARGIDGAGEYVWREADKRAAEQADAAKKSPTPGAAPEQAPPDKPKIEQGSYHDWMQGDDQ